MTRDEVRSLFADLGVWRRGNERAPHKPLLLLMALARYRSGAERLLPFADVDQKLTSLLREFGPHRKSYHPELPFWYLKNDGVWEVIASEDLRKHVGAAGHPSKKVLVATNACGGVPEHLHARLVADAELLREVTSDLLAAHFPPSIHEDVLSAVGLEFAVVKAVRDARFRHEVLLAYEFRCAICGFDARLTDALVGIEAAHVKWHQAGGPGVVQNGLTLCSLHHKLFDRGAFTITSNGRLEVSRHLHGGPATLQLVVGFHSKEIAQPDDPGLRPLPEFIAWHRKQVFRQPGRWIDQHVAAN